MENRRQLYKKNRLTGMNPFNAARAAGYSLSMSYNAKRIEKATKLELTDAFEQAGLTDKEIVKKALAGLDAVEDGKPNWTIRHKYLQTILSVTGRLKSEINIDNSRHLNNVYLSTLLKEARMRINDPTVEQP